MSWLSKLCAVVLVTSISGVALEHRFSGGGDTAKLEVQLKRSRGPMESVEFELTVPTLSLTADESGFQTLAVPGLTPMGQVGSPDLYTTGVLIAVPAGFEPSVVIENIDSQEISGVVVTPTQHLYRCSGGQPDGFRFNSRLYASNELFPSTNVSLEPVGKIQDVRIVRVGLYPIQNHLGTQTLKIATGLRGRVDFVATGGQSEPVRLTRTLASLVRSVAVNGQSMAAREGDVHPVETMLVVSADGLVDSLRPLIDWKQSKGIQVHVASLTEAGGTKEKIKEFVQNYYDNAVVKPSYLLFVGNKSTLPAYMEPTSSGSAASDYRYALLSGNDRLPDALYGRIIADSEAEVVNQISRWIAYEKSPDRDASWYKEGSTIASDEGSGPSDQEYAEMVQQALKGYTYSKVDAFNAGDSTATFKNISEAVNQGRSWLAYFGHGSGTSWGSTNDMFGNTQVTQLDNGNKLPILIDVACLNASWVNISKPFGKTWVNATKNEAATGAVAFYGGSVSISWHEPAVMSVGIAKYHFEKPVYSLGASVLAGQLYLIEKMGVGENVWDNLEWYNLFGDPSLMVRTDTPATYEVKHALRSTGRGMSVNVSATDITGKGVGGLLVSIRSTGNPIALGTTDQNGEAEVEIAGVGQLEPGTLLTTTGYNQDTIQQPIK